MSEEPLISVVLPTYNRAATLARSIAGILRQDWHTLELLVVDDASTDNTADVVKQFDDARLRYLRLERNGGASAARNHGVKAAAGEWVAFQDSDDEWDRTDRLRLHWQGLQDLGPDYALLVCCTRCPEKPALSYEPLPGRARLSDAADLVLRRMPPTPCWLARREALLRAGLFDAELDCFEDWELSLRLSAFARIGLLNEVLHLNHYTRGGLFSNEAGYVRNLSRILQRHEAKWAGRPRDLAVYWTLIGHMACLHGSGAQGRRAFRRAIAAAPLAPRPWLSLLASLCGRPLYRRITEAVRARRERAAPHAGRPA